MFAKERGRNVRGVLVTLAAVGGVGVAPAHAQSQAQQGAITKLKNRVTGAASAEPAKAQAPAAAPQDEPRLVQKKIPVNPTDDIAIVNNEVITRARLADECVARKGEEILDTLIARVLIDQALRARKLEVTAAEVDAEIDNIAMRVAGIGREAWLRTLDKERGITPVQYARDIIYPALALRKLAGPRVQVTPLDEQRSFEAQYGDKLRVRMIMVDKVQAAKEIWEDLRKNPAGFEKLAMDRSMDSGSRSLGGLLAEPISRHAFPETVSDSAFSQLVDGDPKDSDSSHKPKDGTFTGPIQVAEATWVILRREGLIPAQPVDPKDPKVKKVVHDMIYEVKLKEEMGKVMIDLMQVASIDNKLTGKIKLANEQPDVDQEIKLMGGKPGPSNTNTSTARPGAGGATRQKTPTPVGLPPEVVNQGQSPGQPVKK